MADESEEEEEGEGSQNKGSVASGEEGGENSDEELINL